MANTKRRPIELILHEDKMHLTKEEIEQRRREQVEIQVGTGEPPEYLNANQRRRFRDIVKPLITLGIYSDLDADCLATYCIASMEYTALTKELAKIDLKVGDEEAQKEYKRIAIERDRAFAQARTTANDLGLNITSRCRIIKPEIAEPPKNKFDQFVK